MLKPPPLTLYRGAFANHCCRGKAVSITYWYVRACLWVLGRVGVCMRISACSLANRAATRMRHIVTSFVAPRSPSYFSVLSHKRCNLWKKGIEHKICVLIFSTTFV